MDRNRNHIFVFRGYLRLQLPEVLKGEFLAFIPVVVYVILTSVLMRGYLW